MSYYVTAHRHGAKIHMPVEEKHKYITDSIDQDFSGADMHGMSQRLDTSVTYQDNTLTATKQDFTTVIQQTDTTATPKYSSISVTGRVQGMNLTWDRIKMFYRPAQLTIQQGTGSRQRIGDKVFLKSVQIIINIAATQSWMTTLAPTKTQANATVTTYRPTAYSTTSTTAGTISTTTHDADLVNVINWRNNIRQWMKFRILIVRFNDLTDVQQVDETALKQYIADWWNKIFVPAAIIPNMTFNSQTGAAIYQDINVVSNQSKMLRESTEYNGKYQIIYDNLIELAQNDPNKHIEIKLDPKMNLTFNSNNHVTDEKFNDTYGFIIPPTFYKMDMDTCTYQAIQTSNGSPQILSSFITNIKFTYYDI